MKKEIKVVRKWFTFITEHTRDEIFTDTTSILEGGDITTEMKEVGIPTTFKEITAHLNNPKYADEVKAILAEFAENETEADDRATIKRAYLTMIFHNRPWHGTLIPILEWYEAIYEWGIPTMAELDKEIERIKDDRKNNPPDED